MAIVPKRLEKIHADLTEKWCGKYLYSKAEFDKAIDEIESVEGFWARHDYCGCTNDGRYWISYIDYIPAEGAIGRPTVEEPRDAHVSFRLTQNEKENLSNLASKSGVSLSNYIHNKLFGGGKIE